MITPEYLNKVIEGTERAVGQLDTALIRRIAKRIADAFYNEEETILIPSSIHDLNKIKNTGFTIEEAEAIIKRYMPDIKDEIHKAFMDAAGEMEKYQNDFARRIIDYAGIAEKVEFVERHGLPKTAADLNMTPAEIRKLEAAYRRTNGEMTNITKTTAKAATKAYVEACDSAYMQVQAGVSPSRAIEESVKALAKKGIRVVHYGNKETDVSVAVARAVRTGVNQANSEMMLQRMAELGVSCVLVSQHLGARVTKNDDYTNHSWWQGKIYSIDWDKGPMKEFEAGETPAWMAEARKKLRNTGRKYPDFVETCGYGDIQGIIGINCRHTFQAWYPGVNVEPPESIDKEENEKRYRLEQRQREMERAMRKTRREIEAQKELAAVNPEAADRVKILKSNLRNMGTAYADFCKKNRLPMQYERTR